LILAHQNLHFLAQGRALLEELTDDQFALGDGRGHASAGAHLRHVLDCYHCFLHGIAEGRVDYDARRRDPRVEKERSVAIQAIDEVSRGLAKLVEGDRHRELEVNVDAVAWGEGPFWTRSTLGRELQFLLSHTVHHYAIIAMTLRSLGFEPDAGFGVAPSTLEHRAGARPGTIPADTAGALAGRS
jgi:uncharacterized damage-inducible protein DinB